VKPVQILLLAFVGFALARVIHKYRNRAMRTAAFAFWVLVWLASALVILFPDSTSFVARLLGIGRGADLIVYSALIASFYLIFRIQLVLDRFEQAMTEVVRTLALERTPDLPKPDADGAQQPHDRVVPGESDRLLRARGGAVDPPLAR